MSDSQGNREAPPAGSGSAIARAERHGRRALAELLLGLRALIDAAAFATTGRPASAGALEPFWLLAGELADLFAGADGGEEAAEREDELLRALADALDEEIARWETKSGRDPDATSVLRAFVGLRELLDELGFLPSRRRAGPRPVANPATEARTRRA